MRERSALNRRTSSRRSSGWMGEVQVADAGNADMLRVQTSCAGKPDGVPIVAPPQGCGSSIWISTTAASRSLASPMPWTACSERRHFAPTCFRTRAACRSSLSPTTPTPDTSVWTPAWPKRYVAWPTSLVFHLTLQASSPRLWDRTLDRTSVLRGSTLLASVHSPPKATIHLSGP